MKKAARDQLPHLESDGTVELGDNKMANRPEREARQKPGPDIASKAKTATFTPISNLVSRAIKQPNRICLTFTRRSQRITMDTMLRDLVYHNNAELAQRKERNKIFAHCFGLRR